jgi:hypothetical protein
MSGALATGAFTACTSDDNVGSPSGDAGVTPDGSVAETGTPDAHGDASAEAAGDGGPDASVDVALFDAIQADVSLPDVSLPDVVTLPDVNLPDVGLPGLDGSSPGLDASTDGGAMLDAPVDSADGAAPTFCSQQVGLAFCADFDEPNSLSTDAGASPWTQLVGTMAELSLSTAQAMSPPTSLLAALAIGPANTDQSAKVVEWVTPTTGVAQAIYEFDMLIAHLPLGAGGFATDFQFVDVGGNSDQFGFRIGLFSNASGGLDHADLEHNQPVLGAGDINAGSIPLVAGAWQHVKMVVAYSASTTDAGADAGDIVHFQLYIDQNATAAVDAIYPAPFTRAPFARFAAGIVYAFDGTNKDWSIYYDNFTLALQ